MFFLHLGEILNISSSDSAGFRCYLAGPDDWSPRVRVKSVAVIDKVFRWMHKQRWYIPDNGVYSKLISVMGKKGQTRMAMWLLHIT